MTKVASLKTRDFSLPMKLRILREKDPAQSWHSLDETRYCILCERVIRGHDIIFRRDDTDGGFTAVCPTAGCTGSYSEWVRSGNPLTSQEAWREWERILDEVSGEEMAPNRRDPPVVCPCQT